MSLRMDVVTPADSDPTVAKAMRGLSALRLLSKHLEGLRVTTLSCMPYEFAEQPHLAVQLHTVAGGLTFAERIGGVDWTVSEVWRLQGYLTWNGYPLTVSAYERELDPEAEADG